MRTYVGEKVGDDYRVWVDDGGRQEPIRLRYDLRRHSEFPAWGYAGSGPAQLALALLCDALRDDERAEALYQRFKFAVVSTLPAEGWRLTEEQVRATAAELEAARKTG